MARDLVARVEAYHAQLNAYDPVQVSKFFSADAEYHSPGVGVLVGRRAIIAAMSGYFAEYPDQVAVDDVMEQVAPDRVRSEWRLAATSKTTGQQTLRSGVETVTFDEDGLIRRVQVEDR
ncbi:nuclear transport factor 2 family protein [Aestuariivirga sp.]|uniref:nuclear transport factor 2 family protein n=1 Tax=Aestuariivirga sp. TaxID=2650926 RepID=UPI0039E3394B